MLALSPTQLFTGDDVIESATVRIEDGRILGVTQGVSRDAIKLDGLLAPGFIDIQVNGGGGVLFNDSQSVETLSTIARAHRRFGVTGFMATLISDERSKAASALDAVGDAIAAGVDGLLGLHLEGPWLSAPRRGVHPVKFLREMDDADLKLLTRKRPFPVMVTLAPEQIGPEAITALAAASVTISLGHTAASAEEVEYALAAGATGFTHLFNAMPPLEGRNPGPLGVALGARESWAGLILDGIHVHPAAARAAFAAKTASKLILVSDAMATIGADDPAMSLFGETIKVSGGALRTMSGTLAGAHLELSGAVRNAVSMLGATREDALRMASTTPSEFLHVAQDRGRIAPGLRADLVLLDANLNVRTTWIGGREVH
ncbi:MAG: N-acetylglucosamine-6-phosphate deacetylase [Hyphomonadaceae bacterium]